MSKEMFVEAIENGVDDDITHGLAVFIKDGGEYTVVTNMAPEDILVITNVLSYKTTSMIANAMDSKTEEEIRKGMN